MNNTRVPSNSGGKTLLLPIMFAVVIASTPALAHHSYAKFDLQTFIEVEGVLTEVRWQNPHVKFILRGKDANGQDQFWELETNSPGMLRRSGLDKNVVAVGDQVKVAGNPTVNGSFELNATNMLMPNGRELLLDNRGSMRFADLSVTGEDIWGVTEGDTSQPELGIFRTWSSTVASALTLFPDHTPGFTLLDYPLTPTARRTVETFDAIEGSRQLASNCTPKGMPWIMEQPYDIRFEQDSNDILFKLEEFDTVRHIHMNWNGDRDRQSLSPLGFSTGVWEGAALVVTTTHLNSPNFKFGIPASTQASILERFTPSADGAKLDYEIVVTDTETFTEPVSIKKFWISIPSQDFDAYNCGRPL